MKHYYSPKYRPPGYATVPGNDWELEERGTRGDNFPLRRDLADGLHAFGVISYNRDLSPEDVASYELIDLGTAYTPVKLHPTFKR